MGKAIARIETFENDGGLIRYERWSVLHYRRVAARQKRFSGVTRCKRCGKALFRRYCPDCQAVLNRWYQDGVWRSPESARRCAGGEVPA